jgi:Holliday junction resolvase RusA-like endonuclease
MKFVLPLEVYIPRKTKADQCVRLNKNVERNLHYTSYNEAKIIFSDLLVKQCKGKVITEFPQVAIFHIYAKKSAKGNAKGRLVDVDNYSILPKFALDALVKHGVMPDDNFNYISQVTIRFIKHDVNARAEMFLMPDH